MSSKNKKNKNITLVTRTYLPPLDEYVGYLRRIWKARWVTNNGPFARKLEKELAKRLGVKHVFFVSNGTVALQIALRAMDIKKEVITTPFSYVATTNSILWEYCKPVFVDIDPKTFCIDPKKIKAAITENTQAIMAVHVFGQPCDVVAIGKIAKKHKLKVIYDAAHAFDVDKGDTSILKFGDVSTLSLHATKLFHSGEGGVIACESDELAKKIDLLRAFGHINDEYFEIGINGKNSEIHAALGLANLPHVNEIKKLRKIISVAYDNALAGCNVQFMQNDKDVSYNYSYYPVVFRNEDVLMNVLTALRKRNIFPRRYFYPSLNTLPFLRDAEVCTVSESISKRILCLPLYHDLPLEKVIEISSIIRSVLAGIDLKDIQESSDIPASTQGINIHNLLRLTTTSEMSSHLMASFNYCKSAVMQMKGVQK